MQCSVHERYGLKQSSRATGVVPGSSIHVGEMPVHFLTIDLGLWQAYKVSNSPEDKRPLETMLNG
jgi:hypothetical protein